MRRFLKAVICSLALGIMILCFAWAALAVPSLEVKADGVNVDPGETRLVSSKTVSVSVYDSNGEAKTVYVNSKKAKSVAGEVYRWEIAYSLATGKNDIKIVAQGAGDPVTFEFDIMYVTSPVPGLSYSVPSLPASGKIEAFNKALILTCPKNNILVDGNGNVWGDGPGEDLSVAFVVYQPAGKLSFATLASPNIPFVVEITADAGAYLLQPGQLTLSYNSSVSSSVADQLAIWYSPDNDWGDSNNLILGGYVNTSKHTVTVPFQFSGSGIGYYAVFLAQREFQEFTGASGAEVAWSYSCVMPLWAKGIIEQLPLGRTDNSFGLTTSINRLEFATMMVRGLGLPLAKKPGSTGEQIFNDGPFDGKYFYEALPEDISGSYFDNNYSTITGPNYRIYEGSRMPVQYVETAARNGIVAGYPDGSFGPEKGLKRQEAAVILTRAANLKLSTDDEKVRQDLEKIFEDADSISLWAAPSVLAAQKAKLIVGKPGDDPKKLKFDPGGTLSRAEAITFTYRLMKKLKKI